jgi:hypothetical protein
VSAAAAARNHRGCGGNREKVYRRSGGPDPDFIAVVDSLVGLDLPAVQLHIEGGIYSGDSICAIGPGDFDHRAIARSARSLRQPNLYITVVARADANVLGHDDLS